MADIQHIIVLMLENRSFDSMLGVFEDAPAHYNGLTLHEYNDYDGRPYPVNNRPLGDNRFAVPTPDPGEKFTDMAEQLLGGMSGFAQNYATQHGWFKHYDPAAAMHYYTRPDVPVLHQLAHAFGVSDQWFAAAPCQTWPNRFFAHCGTCEGVVNNSDFITGLHVPLAARSIFGALEQDHIPWRIYFHDFPQSLLLHDVIPVAISRMRHFSQFLADAKAGALPRYSFIEPKYFGNFFTGTPPNDQHPPHDIRYGEQLIAAVYNAVRASPCWDNTLLVITYDEHGGLYDHQVPPAAAAPGGPEPAGYAFNTYGVRVPAVIVSPWLPPRSLLQPQAQGLPPFDHTSLIKTVQERFSPANPLRNPRIDAAPSLLPYLTLPGPANDGPAKVFAHNLTPSREEMRAIGAAPPNDLHLALAQAADGLERGFGTPAADMHRETESVAALGIRAARQVRNFLGLS